MDITVTALGAIIALIIAIVLIIKKGNYSGVINIKLI